MKRRHLKLAPEGRETFLAPLVGKGVTIGFVEEIHGCGGVECGEYKPTQYELEALATHWATEIAGIQVFQFYTQQTCCHESRLEPYAAMRLKRIAHSIGKEAVKKATKKVWEEERKRMGEDDWRIFTEGTSAEWDVVAARTHGRIDEEERCREEARPAKGLDEGQ